MRKLKKFIMTRYIKNKYVGKYFKRITKSDDISVFRINDFDGKYFIVTYFYLHHLGYSTQEENLRVYPEFLTQSNFIQIPKTEYDAIKSLCINPYTTFYDDNNRPYYKKHNEKRK